MNKNQKIALFVTAGVLLVMLVFPPFSYERKQYGDQNLGYRFILNEPPRGLGSIDTKQLLLQASIVAIAGGIISFALSGDGREAEQDRLS